MVREPTRLSNGSREVDVEFPTLEESSDEPPNPDYLRVHTSFAKVLHLSGAADYIERVERDAEMEGTLHLDGKTDIVSFKSTAMEEYQRECIPFDSIQCYLGSIKCVIAGNTVKSSFREPSRYDPFRHILPSSEIRSQNLQLISSCQRNSCTAVYVAKCAL
jgi:hypothetical protein